MTYGAELEYSDFTLYFLAFDHSGGKATEAEKKAGRLQREGTPFPSPSPKLSHVAARRPFSFSYPRTYPQPRYGDVGKDAIPLWQRRFEGIRPHRYHSG